MAGKRRILPLAVSVIVVALLLVAALGVLFTGGVQQGAAQAGSLAPSEATQSTKDWPMMNHDYSNTRATNDSAINSSNVNSLGLAWNFTITGLGAFGGGTTNPVIVGDNVYFQDLKGSVFNLDLATGKVNWNTTFNSSGLEGPNGVAVGYGKVFVMTDLWNVTALNASDGKELWRTSLFVVNTTGIDIQPYVFDNKVYVSSVPGTGDIFYAPGGIGVLYALDQATGNVAWNFTTIKDNNLDNDPGNNSGGGSWYPPAIDEATGIMYWSVANPAPFFTPGSNNWSSGASFDGMPYTDSLVALDHSTGQLKWATQVLKHDIWDHDLQISPILVNSTWNGVQRDMVLSAGKMGTVYAFDRATGALLWSTPVGEHMNDLVDPIPKNGTTTVEPGAIGGVETVMAYSNGMVYVPVVNLPMQWNFSSGLQVTGINLTNATGQLVAINVSTGHIAWQTNTSKANYGAATVVNDVVFTADAGGNITAYNTTTGKLLFNYTAPAGINGWPAVSNDTIVWPAGVGSNPQVIALRLGASNATGNQTGGGAAGGNQTGGNTTGNTSGAIELTAQNIAFDKSTITVKAGQQVTINFHNQDGGIPHNFAVYTDSSASTSIFKGNIITGVADTTYTFTAPSTPGTYFFRCDVHPTQMTGSLVVQ